MSIRVQQRPSVLVEACMGRAKSKEGPEGLRLVGFWTVKAREGGSGGMTRRTMDLVPTFSTGAWSDKFLK